MKKRIIRKKQKVSRISVVIPAHNEAENLARLVPKLKKALGKYLYEVIAIDAESTDDTRKVGKMLEKQYSFFILAYSKSGVGHALRKGYKKARGDWVLSIDCDFLKNMVHFKLLIDRAEKGYDMVIGSRYIPGGKLIGYPPFKKFANRTYHSIARMSLRIPLKDLTNNFKLMRREIAVSIPSKEAHFAANAETGIYPCLMGYDISEVPVPWIQRDFGGSKFSTMKLSVSYLRVFLRAFYMKNTGKLKRISKNSEKSAKHKIK